MGIESGGMLKAGRRCLSLSWIAVLNSVVEGIGWDGSDVATLGDGAGRSGVGDTVGSGVGSNTLGGDSCTLGGAACTLGGVGSM